jgi:hypothetical protein
MFCGEYPHGHSDHVINMVRKLKQRFPNVPSLPECSCCSRGERSSRCKVQMQLKLAGVLAQSATRNDFKESTAGLDHRVLKQGRLNMPLIADGVSIRI